MYAGVGGSYQQTHFPRLDGIIIPISVPDCDLIPMKRYRSVPNRRNTRRMNWIDTTCFAVSPSEN